MVFFFIIIPIAFPFFIKSFKNYDLDKLDIIYQEMSKTGKPFPKKINNKTILAKSPRFNLWTYKSESENSFSLYYFKGSNLYVRNYPLDNHWELTVETWWRLDWVNMGKGTFVDH
jgi:hypothetical protein